MHYCVSEKCSRLSADDLAATGHEPARGLTSQGFYRFRSLADNLHQHPLLPPSIEFPIENLLPRTEVELSLGNRHHHLAPHHLAFQMRVRVVLPSPIMQVLR